MGEEPTNSQRTNAKSYVRRTKNYLCFAGQPYHTRLGTIGLRNFPENKQPSSLCVERLGMDISAKILYIAIRCRSYRKRYKAKVSNSSSSFTPTRTLNMLASLSRKTQTLVQTPLFKPSHAHLDVKGRTKFIYERARAIARVYSTTQPTPSWQLY